MIFYTVGNNILEPGSRFEHTKDTANLMIKTNGYPAAHVWVT